MVTTIFLSSPASPKIKPTSLAIGTFFVESNLPAAPGGRSRRLTMTRKYVFASETLRGTLTL